MARMAMAFPSFPADTAISMATSMPWRTTPASGPLTLPVAVQPFITLSITTMTMGFPALAVRAQVVARGWGRTTDLASAALRTETSKMQENKNRLRLALDDAPETGNVLEPRSEEHTTELQSPDHI